MRHQVFGKKLNRDVKERKALFKSLVIALIQHGKIKTTVAKAKAIKGLVDKLVTKAKNGSNNAKLQLSSFLTQKEVINKLILEVAPRFKDKIGGYLRLIKLGKRHSDHTEEAILTWSVEEVKKQDKEKKKDNKTAETEKKKIKKEEKKNK